MSSIWLKNASSQRGSLEGEESCSIAIIGGGLVGVAAAFYLSQAGCDVALVEKDRLGSGATGRSNGFLLNGIHHYYSKSKSVHGPEKTRTLWRLSRQNHGLLEDLIRKEKISCGHRRTGSYRAALSDPEAKVLRESAEDLRRDGFPVEERDLPGFIAASYCAEDGVFHPVDFVQGLAGAAERNGARFYEGSRVKSVRGAVVETSRGVLRGEMVLFAGGGFSPLLHPFLGETIAPVRGQCLCTRPVSERVIPAPMLTNWGLDSLVQLPGGEIIAGGGRHVAMQNEYTWSEKTSVPVQEYLDQFLRERLSLKKIPEITHRWAGVMDFACDELPNVGPLPGTVCAYAVAGFHGSGLSLGLVSARMVSEMMLEGKTGYPCELFSPRRHL